MQIFMSMRDRGRTADSRAVLARAVDLLEREPPGRELVRALGMQTRDRQMASEQPEALAFAERALALAAELGEEDLALTVLWRRGVSRYESGDPGGIEDIREALRRLLEKGMSPEAAFAYNGLGDAVWFEEGPERGIAVFEEGIAFSERRGLTFDAMWMRGSTVWPTYEAGRWDEAVRSAESLIREALATDATQVGIMGGDCLGLILAKRGDFAGAGAVTDEWLPRARVIEDPQMLIPALTGAALVAASRADRAGAAALLGEIADLSGAVAGNFASILKLEALRLAADLGDAELLAALHDMPVASPRRRALMDAGAEAIRLQFVGDPAASEAYAVGADAWGEYGNVVEQGEALGGQGRTLVGIGRGEDALTPLRAARDAFEALGARNRVAEIDGWIARAGGRPT